MSALAERLLGYEGLDSHSPEKGISSLLKTFKKLRDPLVTFAGAQGFRSLLTRALNLSIDEEPWLSSIRVNEEGSLELQLEQEPSFEETTRGGILLLAHLLSLLTTFIGEGLTLNLITRIWPEISEPILQSGNSNDPT